MTTLWADGNHQGKSHWTNCGNKLFTTYLPQEEGGVGWERSSRRIVKWRKSTCNCLQSKAVLANSVILHKLSHSYIILCTSKTDSGIIETNKSMLSNLDICKILKQTCRKMLATEKSTLWMMIYHTTLNYCRICVNSGWIENTRFCGLYSDIKILLFLKGIYLIFFSCLVVACVNSTGND